MKDIFVLYRPDYDSRNNILWAVKDERQAKIDAQNHSACYERITLY